MWRWLRGRRFEGLKFRRQHPIGRFIVDFYCPELRLAVELDGSRHDPRRDAERTTWLEQSGVMVIRVANSWLDRDEDGVYDFIRAAIEQRRVSRANASAQ